MPSSVLIATVKVLDPGLPHFDQLREAFLREARATVQLDHPNVVDVLAYLVAVQGMAWNGHTTWLDLEGLATGQDVNVPQQVLNVSDLQRIQFGFKGYTYQQTPQQEDPGDCPP